MPQFLAYALSVFFHPLLIATYMISILLLVNPYLFGANNMLDRWPLIAMMLFNTFLVPSFMVLMLKQLGFVKTLEMEDREERIIPYILVGFFYISMTVFFIYNPEIPTAFTSFMLGTTIALFVAFFINLFSKISAHAVGMGGLVGMIAITTWLFSYGAFQISIGHLATYQINMILLLAFALLLSGLVGTARLRLGAHTMEDLMGGYLVGFISQLIALRFLF
ncbi:MAG: hypothetical protein AAF738_00880 [Bacteroidota bacterium]